MDQDPPPEDSKLTHSKRRWVEEGRFLTGQSARPDTQRLPPGQHLVRNWPVLDLGTQPDVPVEKWVLAVGGLVANPVKLDWAALQAMPQTTRTNDIHCVTSWSRFDNEWQGVAVHDLLDLVDPLPEARAVMLFGSDGYSTNLLIEDFASADAIIATHWGGEPLVRDHGGPARLVVPHLYFWKSAKWITRINFLAEDEPGFWEDGGYHMRGDPWKEERYD
jgi:DMSO/TMAO reductase YedYZ molybdopterin-dependent catalytic subunit